MCINNQWPGSDWAHGGFGDLGCALFGSSGVLSHYLNQSRNASHIADYQAGNRLANIANATGAQVGLQNACIPPEVARLRKAQATAAEVRARRPEMQVRRIA
jgi:predicted aconitase